VLNTIDTGNTFEIGKRRGIRLGLRSRSAVHGEGQADRSCVEPKSATATTTTYRRGRHAARTAGIQSQSDFGVFTSARAQADPVSDLEDTEALGSGELTTRGRGLLVSEPGSRANGRTGTRPPMDGSDGDGFRRLGSTIPRRRIAPSVDHPRFRDDHAYVSGGVLVAKLAEALWTGGSVLDPDLFYPVEQVVLTARLARVGTPVGASGRHGRIRSRVQDLISVWAPMANAVRSHSRFSEPRAYDSVKQLLCPFGTSPSGPDFPSSPCDALSGVSPSEPSSVARGHFGSRQSTFLRVLRTFTPRRIRASHRPKQRRERRDALSPRPVRGARAEQSSQLSSAIQRIDHRLRQGRRARRDTTAVLAGGLTIDRIAAVRRSYPRDAREPAWRADAAARSESRSPRADLGSRGPRAKAQTVLCSAQPPLPILDRHRWKCDASRRGRGRHHYLSQSAAQEQHRRQMRAAPYGSPPRTCFRLLLRRCRRALADCTSDPIDSCRCSARKASGRAVRRRTPLRLRGLAQTPSCNGCRVGQRIEDLSTRALGPR